MEKRIRAKLAELAAQKEQALAQLTRCGAGIEAAARNGGGIR